MEKNKNNVEILDDEGIMLKEEQEILEDLKISDNENITIHSRDWTVETILNQIRDKNIDLNPKFQRRNVWNDEKRSRLIESLILGYPIPEIMLAESVSKKKSFLVIDGKQRLLAIAGFVDSEKNKSWSSPKISGLKTLKELNGLTYEELKSTTSFSDSHRAFINADIRCIAISGYKKDDILYDIFWRLNTGSVLLSTQELRQALIRGEFSDYLIEITNEKQPIHNILKLNGPDKRLKDIEIILRFLSFVFFSQEYEGNLKKFLDDSMSKMNENWKEYENKIKKVYIDFNNSIEKLKRVFRNYEKIGRKYTNEKMEDRFNRALFEIEVYYFMYLDSKKINNKNIKKFNKLFNELCNKDSGFRESIESTTKTTDRVKTRFNLFKNLINKSFTSKIQSMPLKK